jgi:hypothetical protein
MSVAIQEIPGLNFIEIELHDKLSKDDFQHFVPQIEEQIRQHGKLRILLHMQDFHGWTAGGLWEEIKFDLKHFTHLERIAFVGDQRWEANLSKFCKPFTSAEIRFFPPAQIDQARAWLQGPLAT